MTGNKYKQLPNAFGKIPLLLPMGVGRDGGLGPKVVGVSSGELPGGFEADSQLSLTLTR
jgi:hypothetical protein